MNHPKTLLALFAALTAFLGTAPALASPSPNIPLPVLVIKNKVQTDGSGHALSNWNGTNVDLLAADAWAQCAPILFSGTADQSAASADASNPTLLDSYMSYLVTQIENSPCSLQSPPASAPLVVHCPTTGCTGIQMWARQRETPTCNVDPSTGEPIAVTFYPNTQETVNIPPASAFTDLSGNVDGAVSQAQFEVDIAELNLCMGQRLTEYISSADSLLLTAIEQLQLVEVTRERAQLAMVHFAEIARALANEPPARISTIGSSQQIFPLFRSWASRASGDAALQQLGLDFAAAVQLHTQITQDEAQLFARSGSARIPRGGQPQSTPETDFGSGSWRQRVNALLYGGNPLANGVEGSGDIDLTQPGSIQRWLQFSQPGGLGSVPWNTTWTEDNTTGSLFTWPNQVPPITSAEYYATTDETDPRAKVLLGLARQADLVLLKERNADVVLPFNTQVTVPFRRVDIATSAAQMYYDVEAYLETQECLKKGQANCTVSPTVSDGSDITSYSTYLLFQRYGVTPDHAKLLVAALADALSRKQLPDLGLQTLLTIFAGNIQPSQMSETEGAMHVVGANGTLSPTDLQARIPGAMGTWYHIDQHAKLYAPGVEERAPLFSVNAYNWKPVIYGERVTSVAQGWAQLDQDKDMGAISALSVTRQLVDLAVQTATAAGNTGLMGTYFAESTQLSAALDAALGTDSVTVQPTLGPGTASSSGITPTQQSTAAGAKVLWDIAIRHAPDDPFLSGVTSPNTQLNVIAVKAAGLEASAAISPAFVSVGGESQQDLLVNGQVGSATIISSTTLPDNTVLRWYRIALPSIAFGSDSVEATSGLAGPVTTSYVSLFWQKTIADQPTQYYLLARHVGLTVSGATVGGQPVYSPVDGQYFSFRGTLGDLSRHAWATQPENASKPQYDGFGFATDWVPPSDPSLYGGTNASGAVSYYVGQAQTAAAAAGMAVQDAINELLLEDADNAALATAQKKAAGLDAIAASSLCGQPTCDTSTQTVDLFKSGFLPILTCGPNNSQLCGELSVAAIVKVPARVTLATPVVKTINDLQPPSFSDYAGGTIQDRLITEWNALQALKSALTTAFAQEQAQDAAMASAAADQALANGQAAADCNPAAFHQALLSCFNWQMGTDDYVIDYQDPSADGWNLQLTGDQGKSFSIGPLVQQYNLCHSEMRALPAAAAKDAATVAAAYAWLPTAISSFLSAGGNLQQAIADLQQTEHSAQMAQAQANLDAALAGQDLQTKFGTSVRYHSYDMFRALALLESARRYAVAARREIEARYVVDLSQLLGDEPFVAAPASWADNVYEYDLSPPSAVGVTATPGASNMSGSPIYANTVTDYVNNLSGFVQGFAVNRPTATVSTDDDMFALPGPDVFDNVTYNGQQVQVLDAGSQQWEFWCDATQSWILNPAESQLPAVDTLMTACPAMMSGVAETGVPPTKARIQFSLDPWTRPEGLVASPPFVDRYNVRWSLLAVNLVGTGLLDCSRASDPSTCFSQSYVPMNLTHVGPAWVSDFNENWRFLAVPDGEIEGGKALAAEQWLDPVANGFSKPYVAAVARQEFRDRPVGGTYQLELELGPQVVLGQLQSVQVLTETAYWVKQ